MLWKEGKARHMIGASTDVFVFCFLNLPPKTLKKTLFAPLSLVFFFWFWAAIVLGGYQGVVPQELGTESDRAHCPARLECA